MEYLDISGYNRAGKMGACGRGMKQYACVWGRGGGIELDSGVEYKCVVNGLFYFIFLISYCMKMSLMQSCIISNQIYEVHHLKKKHL